VKQGIFDKRYEIWWPRALPSLSLIVKGRFITTMNGLWTATILPSRL
jgi:hypothetical protein